MNLTEVIDNATALPPAPEILPKLMEVMRDPDADATEIVSLISTDPAIVAGVLKLANSSLYAPPNPIADLTEAVGLLGIREIYRIVNFVTSDTLLDGELSSMEIRNGALWTHSLAVAIIMELIAENHATQEGLPYTLGLLHDIGKLALHQACGEAYVEIFQRVETDRISVNASETLTLGFDHAAVGAQMLENWGFPEDVILPIRYQYSPEKADDRASLAGALQIANWAAGTIGCNDGRDAWALDMTGSGFDIDEATLQRAILEGQERVQQAKRALGTGRN